MWTVSTGANAKLEAVSRTLVYPDPAACWAETDNPNPTNLRAPFNAVVGDLQWLSKVNAV